MHESGLISLVIFRKGARTCVARSAILATLAIIAILVAILIFVRSNGDLSHVVSSWQGVGINIEQVPEEDDSRRVPFSRANAVESFQP